VERCSGLTLLLRAAICHNYAMRLISSAVMSVLAFVGAALAADPPALNSFGIWDLHSSGGNGAPSAGGRRWRERAIEWD